MKRLVIAVDCDDVLVLTTQFLLDAYNQQYGTSVTPTQLKDMSYDLWQADEALVIERWSQLTKVDDYAGLGPSPEDAAILHELAKSHELHLITARKEYEREATKVMLGRELKGVFTSMEFVGWTGSKGEVCRRIGADILVDDNANHLHDAIQHGLPEQGALLFGDHPWNLSDRGSSTLTHCMNWSAVALTVDGIASQVEAS